MEHTAESLGLPVDFFKPADAIAKQALPKGVVQKTADGIVGDIESLNGDDLKVLEESQGKPVAHLNPSKLTIKEFDDVADYIKSKLSETEFKDIAPVIAQTKVINRMLHGTPIGLDTPLGLCSVLLYALQSTTDRDKVAEALAAGMSMFGSEVKTRMEAHMKDTPIDGYAFHEETLQELLNWFDDTRDEWLDKIYEDPEDLSPPEGFDDPEGFEIY